MYDRMDRPKRKLATHEIMISNGSSPETVESLGMILKKEKRKAVVKPKELHRVVQIQTQKGLGEGAHTGGNHFTVETSVLQKHTSS